MRLRITNIIMIIGLILACPVFAQGEAMEITSPSFQHEQKMPRKFSCQGDDISPELRFTGIPDAAVSLVLINDDPDAPGGTWDHWILFNIPVQDVIAENSAPGTQGHNSWGRNDYGGPCPPSGTHRYFFKVYALDTELNLSEGATKTQVEKAMEGHVLDHATLIGLYKK